MTLVATLLALVRQIRLQRALRRLLARLLQLCKSRSSVVGVILCSVLLTGCDEREQQLHRWQQEQVAQVQQHAQQNADATRALITAQAESRREFFGLERDLAQRRDALEADRQAVAAARQRVPLLANFLQGSGLVVLGALALLICGYLLVAARRNDPGSELEETLLLELGGESTLLTASSTALPSEEALQLANSATPAVEIPISSLTGPDSCPTS